MDGSKLKLNCQNCSGQKFYLQDGLYFCEECDVQFSNMVEMEYEGAFDDNPNANRERLRFSRKQKDQARG